MATGFTQEASVVDAEFDFVHEPIVEPIMDVPFNEDVAEQLEVNSAKTSNTLFSSRSLVIVLSILVSGFFLFAGYRYWDAEETKKIQLKEEQDAAAIRKIELNKQVLADAKAKEAAELAKPAKEIELAQQASTQESAKQSFEKQSVAETGVPSSVKKQEMLTAQSNNKYNVSKDSLNKSRSSSWYVVSPD